jgi:hypothetical protein
MKVETVILAATSALALALAHPSAAQVAFASAAVLAASRIEQRRKQRKQKALQREPER